MTFWKSASNLMVLALCRLLKVGVMTGVRLLVTAAVSLNGVGVGREDVAVGGSVGVHCGGRVGATICVGKTLAVTGVRLLTAVTITAPITTMTSKASTAANAISKRLKFSSIPFFAGTGFFAVMSFLAVDGLPG